MRLGHSYAEMKSKVDDIYGSLSRRPVGGVVSRVSQVSQVSLYGTVGQCGTGRDRMSFPDFGGSSAI